MGSKRMAIVAFGLVVAVGALMGCSSGTSTPTWNQTTAASPCDPCAPAPAPCDPCSTPAPCDPCAQPVGERPPNARPGEVWCYVRVPAVNRTVEEQVCIQPAACRQEWVCPVNETVEEQVCTCPEQVRKIPIPAVFETVCEQIMVCPAKTEWQRVSCEPNSLGEGEQLGECWTLVEVPPVYESRQKQVCVQQETCREEIIPAQYETRCKEVCVQPGYYKNIDVPPVYETRCREELVCPARWEWRRTTECEVPCDPGMGAMAPAPMAVPDMVIPPADDSFGSGSPDAGAPPSGELPPADPFVPAR